ncbi:MAG: ATP-binding protein [Streptosporangiales bacterium]|nr:ATP-binding protein [Streptosporangiales bacterium]
MSAQPVPGLSRAQSPAFHATVAFAVSAMVAIACMTWVLLTTPPGDTHMLVAVLVGGTACALMVVTGVTAAVYFGSVANEARAADAASQLRARRIEDEFFWLARETLPVIARRVGNGATPEEVFEGIPRPESDAVRSLLTTIQRLATDVMEKAAAVQGEAEEAAESARAEAEASAERATSAAEELAAIEAEASRLGTEAIPAALDQLRAGEPRDMVLSATSEAVSPALSGLFGTVVTELAVAERRAASAMAACANAAARVQAQTTRMLADLREMEQRYGDDKVFADLMTLDHLVSQTGRFADSIALLSGGRSGRRWTRPIPVESVLRGAMGRIDAYQRVRVHSTCTTAISGYAAEGVMHALAELMDNATAFSAHGSAVHVYVEEEDAGLVVTIEDSGLGMRARERERAERAVAKPLDLATLPGTRLGLAVVGRVADRYGLSVSFRPSARGGTGVVVMIPRALLSAPRDAAAPGWWPGRDSADGSGSDPGAAPDPPGESGTQPITVPGQLAGQDEDTYELPVRPRGKTLAEASRTSLGPRTEIPRHSSNDAGSRFAAFRNSRTGHTEPGGTGADQTITEADAVESGSDHQGSEGTA